MESIIVTGICSGAGKTTLITKIIKKLEHITNKIGIIKYSISNEYEETVITDKKETINMTDTDTALFKKAGADKIIFIKSNRQNLEKALIKARDLIDDVNYLFVEGNSAVDYIKSDLTIYITDKKAKKKKSAEKAE